MNVGLKDILRAQTVLAGQIVRTPMIHSWALDALTGAEVWLKPENWQLTGSFKLRGAYYKMARLLAKDRQRGVITASAGNHGQGVALAGQLLGISVMVVVPHDTPRTKLDGVRRWGAEVVVDGANYDESEAIAARLAAESGRVIVHAFEDSDIVAGQGTVGLEMLQDVPDLDMVLVPTGGGGLICGVGTAARAVNPGLEVVGVQSEASPAWYYAFAAGRPVDVTYASTWAEGLLGGFGLENFEVARQVVDRFTLVSEEDIKAAMRWVLDTHHWVLEGSGAVGLAHILTTHESVRGRRIGVVLTGGNLDISRLETLLAPAQR